MLLIVERDRMRGMFLGHCLCLPSENLRSVVCHCFLVLWSSQNVSASASCMQSHGEPPGEPPGDHVVIVWCCSFFARVQILVRWWISVIFCLGCMDSLQLWWLLLSACMCVSVCLCVCLCVCVYENVCMNLRIYIGPFWNSLDIEAWLSNQLNWSGRTCEWQNGRFLLRLPFTYRYVSSLNLGESCEANSFVCTLHI